MKKQVALLWAVIVALPLLFGQDVRQGIRQLETELIALEEKEKEVLARLEELRLQRIQGDLKRYVTPLPDSGEEVVMHSAMALVYSEPHEQARWVAHIIPPEVVKGMVGRTNDFRPDPAIKTGSAVEEDYFIRLAQPDGTFKYDGFGFDRGHLAPSADFRWSLKALSESYFYSNMSPQRPEFNRVSWARLEDMVRGYVERNQKEVYVLTGPVLHNQLPKVERAKNKPSIPAYYFKAAVDPASGRGIAFIMPNKLAEYPAENYAVSIDSVEKITGLNLFPGLDKQMQDTVEKQSDARNWLAPKEQTDARPLDPLSLPRNHFNTIQAKYYEGKNERITVCGTVVSTKLSSKGNVFLNLDKAFPNQVFTVSIFKDRMVNFSYPPHEFLMSKTVCVEGKVADFNGTPSMVIENESSIRVMDEWP